MFAALLRKALTACCFLLSLVSFAQSAKTPATLLWRISGNSLQQPSYLYGTMHLQDKRLFQFGDSVYRAIETTSGLATEIDFQQAFDSLFNNLDKEAERDKQLAKQKTRFDRSKLDPSAVSLLKKFGVNGNTISAKDLKDIHNYRVRKLLQGGEMNTIVDAFLVGLAQRQAKWTGGIEDLADQENAYDEMGKELKPETVLQSENAYQQGIDNMIKFYLAQDLDRIEEWCNREMGNNIRDAMLIRRNLKMAYRMDSLAAVRPTFFAVGAAHLPGDSGVIRLLRNRGFQVEPVFSAGSEDGAGYASRLDQKEWKVIVDSTNAYTIQMPGKPSEVNKPGEIMKTKLYFDLTTMTIYTAGYYRGFDGKNQALEKTLRLIAKNISGKEPSLPLATVEHKGMQGKEAVVKKDGQTFRIRVFQANNTFYMLMAGTEKKENVRDADINRFFASFVPGGKTGLPKDWKPFTIPGQAFSVRMPGVAMPNKEIDEKTANIPSWLYTTYYTIDPQTQNFYLAQVRQVRASYNIDSDSTYLAALKEEYEARLENVTRYEVTSYRGYPASYMEHQVKEANAEYKTLHVVRGNQVYVLMGGATKGSDMADIDSFLHSLVILPYTKTEWKRTEAAGFASLAPASFKETEQDSASASRRFFAQHCAYNPTDAVSYVVQKSVVSPTFWAASDSSFLEAKAAQYTNETDSLLQKTWVKNGSLKGLDLVVQPAGQASLKKLRLLVNRDTVYTLYSLLQAREGGNEHEQFFDGFRLQNEVAPTIYTSKAALLLQALQTTDSAAFEDAVSDLSEVTFEKTELSLLHKALLASYRDNDEFRSTHNKLIDQILPLADSTTLQFAEAEYLKLETGNGVSKYRLLQLLAQLKTSESFAVLKRLLLLPLPQMGPAIALQKQLLDSMQLSATLFPELLQQAGDSLLATVIAAAANQLLDNDLLEKESLKKYQEQILQGARNEFSLLQKGEYEPWELVRWARLLGWLNEPQGHLLLRKFLAQKDVFLKQAAILSLLKNNLATPAGEIMKVAADKSARLYFYESLREMGKEKMMPAPYATQKSLAESEIYNLFTDDYDEFEVSYIGQRTTRFEDKTQIFHLFKVRLAYEEDGVKRDYLAVAGPYLPAAKEKVLYGRASGFYGDERFLLQKVDTLFKNYLQSLVPSDE